MATDSTIDSLYPGASMHSLPQPCLSPGGTIHPNVRDVPL